MHRAPHAQPSHHAPGAKRVQLHEAKLAGDLVRALDAAAGPVQVIEHEHAAEPHGSAEALDVANRLVGVIAVAVHESDAVRNRRIVARDALHVAQVAQVVAIEAREKPLVCGLVVDVPHHRRSASAS